MAPPDLEELEARLELLEARVAEVEADLRRHLLDFSAELERLVAARMLDRVQLRDVLERLQRDDDRLRTLEALFRPNRGSA